MGHTMRTSMAFLFLAAVSLSGCEADDRLAGDAVSGRVLEEGTGKPIAQAIAVVLWRGNVEPGVPYVEGRGVCYHVETALTDEQGRFSTPAWEEKEKRSYRVGKKGVGAGVIMTAYKNGYSQSTRPHPEPNFVYLEKSKETGDARFEYLAMPVFAGMNCLEGGISKRNLYPLSKSAYEEAKTLELSSKENKERLEILGQTTARLGSIGN